MIVEWFPAWAAVRSEYWHNSAHYQLSIWLAFNRTTVPRSEIPILTMFMDTRSGISESWLDLIARIIVEKELLVNVVLRDCTIRTPHQVYDAVTTDCCVREKAGRYYNPAWTRIKQNWLLTIIDSEEFRRIRTGRSFKRISSTSIQPPSGD
jgi:hypothetical protein